MNGDEQGPKGERSTDEQATPDDPASRQRSSAQVFVADGAGGMRPVDDLRFEEGEWPIDLVVASDRGASWMAYLHAEIEARGWNASSFSQLHPAENSGTISVRTAAGSSPPALDIVYGGVRDARLHLRARPGGHPPLPVDDARQFLARVGERLDAGETDRGHRRELLSYDGLPWRGELWLGGDIRLGPPSKFPGALRQVLVVDAMIDGIGQQGITSNFQIRVHELTIFLGLVLGMHLTPVRWHDEWVPEVGLDGRISDCTLRPVGYSEISAVPRFPEGGSAAPVARRDVSRPGLGPPGISPDMSERWVPSDIEELWATFASLPSVKRAKSETDRLSRSSRVHTSTSASRRFSMARACSSPCRPFVFRPLLTSWKSATISQPRCRASAVSFSPWAASPSPESPCSRVDARRYRTARSGPCHTPSVRSSRRTRSE